MKTNTRPFSIHALELGPMDNFVYMIQDHSSKRAAIVDPAWEMPKVVMLAQHQGFEITDILLTHSHHDHTNGLAEILKTYDAQVHLSKAEAAFWGYQLNKPVLHEDGDTIQLGNTQIEVLHTPGHTPGSVCYYLDGHVITGDTLFVYACGRCDLDGGNAEQMYHSLKKLGSALPPETVIHPGHHYAHSPSSTIGEQLEGNPFMQFDKIADFVDYRLYQHDKQRQTPYSSVKL
jgi:hydroxyacylglutathione hydrolase